MAGMKFSMEADALTNHTKRGFDNNDDLRSLVNQLMAAAEPLSKTFNGPGKAAFNRLKSNTDNVANALQNAHTELMNSATEQNRVFTKAADESADAHTSTESAIDFHAAVTPKF